jgi:hypothetical protein
VNSASLLDNKVITETPRIYNGDQLIMSIANDCFDGSIMTCLKGKVLTYLDTKLGLENEQARAYNEDNVDKVIFDRVGRLLATNEIKVQLPETIFQNTIVSYRADRGLDVDVPKEDEKEEGRKKHNNNSTRGGLLKKKLLLPILLLLKLKMKALMPIFVAIIGLKAMKALILSKLAITIVLGFVLVQLLKKKGMDMPMMMAPMMPPADQYGPPAPAPTPASAPASSYDPSWEPNTGGPYSRVWEASPSSSSSGSNMAYSSYYPSGSSSSGSNSAITSGSSSSSSSSSY